MEILNKHQDTEIFKICKSLFKSSEIIYKELKAGFGLNFLDSTNQSNDEQLELDVFADNCFHQNIERDTNVKYVLSEEREDYVQYGSGKYSLTLDPLDGSKAAVIGIPSGAIFGIFENANVIEDFNGRHIVSGGFFIFGINLEVYFSIEKDGFKGVWNRETSEWSFVELNNLPEYKMFAINVSNKNKWDDWMQDFYTYLIENEDKNGESFNMRWYGSMVAEIKRLIIQGGLFAYPSDSRDGYSNGHLRLVYEAIPMAYLVEAIGGSSTNGEMSILSAKVNGLHQKTPVFIGNKTIIQKIESMKK